MDLHPHPGLKSALPPGCRCRPGKTPTHPASSTLTFQTLNLNRIICNYPVKPQPIISKTFLKLFVFS
jgi:hypothetical protein